MAGQLSPGYPDGSLFAAARTSDPDTSQAAAESMTAKVIGDQCRLILAKVASTFGGANAWDIHKQTGIAQGTVASRLTQLHRAGLVWADGVTKGGSGRNCTRYRMTDVGHKELYR